MEKNGELPDYGEVASEEKPSGGPQKDNLKDAEALLDDNDSSPSIPDLCTGYHTGNI